MTHYSNCYIRLCTELFVMITKHEMHLTLSYPNHVNIRKNECYYSINKEKKEESFKENKVVFSLQIRIIGIILIDTCIKNPLHFIRKEQN